MTVIRWKAKYTTMSNMMSTMSPIMTMITNKLLPSSINVSKCDDDDETKTKYLFLPKQWQHVKEYHFPINASEYCDDDKIMTIYYLLPMQNALTKATTTTKTTTNGLQQTTNDEVPTVTTIHTMLPIANQHKRSVRQWWDNDGKQFSIWLTIIIDNDETPKNFIHKCASNN